MKNQSLSIAVVQHDCDENRDHNRAATIAGIREAAGRGARLILLQELYATRYFCQSEACRHFDLSEPIPGPSTDLLSLLAAELQVVIVASLFEKRAAGLYHNTAVVLDVDGSIAGTYRKMHIPDDPGFYEKFYFAPGDSGFTPIDTTLGRLGVLVCWDQWFPEAARLMALAGAELLLYPTAIGWDCNDTDAEQKRQLDAWVTIQRSHAIANAIPVVACNRSGFEADDTQQGPGIQFWGNSFIAGAQGEVLAMAASTPTVLVHELELQRTEQVRRTWPFLRDRRIDAYGDLNKRYRD
ncbi:MAG: carbon-nitrogen hydrolase [Gammaproteobacteria bacterium]|nr:carbon-nitrogen hydrolase [Gammaproteobacteria bacterium]